MRFTDFFIGNMVADIILYVGSIFIVSRMLEMRVSWKKAVIAVLASSILFGFITSMIGYSLIHGGEDFAQLLSFINTVTSLSIEVIFLRFLFGRRSISTYLYVDTFISGIVMIPDTLLFWMTDPFIGKYIHGRVIIVIHNTVWTFLDMAIAIFIIVCLLRTRMKKVYLFLLETPGVCWTLVIMHFILNTISYTMMENSFEKWGMVWRIVNVIMVVVIPIVARELILKKRLRDSQELIRQQQNYLSRLENVQSQLRMIQHDYKNMISGLYSQVREGNLVAAKEYMEEKLLKIDEHIQDDIKQMKQMEMIKNPDVKNLMITKIMAMIQQDITVHVEVTSEIDQVSMEIEDLVRCLEILLDNSMEAVQGHQYARVAVVLLNESKKLFVMIKNDVYSDIDISKIYQEKYSTKGVNRGQGLPGFRQIVEKYANVVRETRIEEGQLIQSLTIIGKKDFG